MNITKWKKPIWRSTYCMIPTIRHSGKGKTMYTAKRSEVTRGWGKEEWISRVQKIFRVVKLLWMKQWWIRVIYTFVKTYIESSARVNLSVNYGLWVMSMCQYRFIGSNKCNTGEVLVVGGCFAWVVGGGIYGYSLYSLLNFAVHLKLL